MQKTSDSTRKTLEIDTFHIQVGYLEGKILTIVEASFADLEQRGAVKQLVKRMFREQRNHVDSIVYGTSASEGSSGKEYAEHNSNR